MIKRSKRHLGLAVTSMLAATMVLSACGQANNAGNNSPAANNSATSNTTNTGEQGNTAADTSTEVKLKLVLLGAKPADYDAVFAEINKNLKEKINATVEAEFLAWSDWSQKYPLKFAANEDFDIIYTSNWAQYSDQATKGGFLELTDDLLSKYAPQTWAAMPKVKWDQARINGKVYMIPSNKANEFTDKLVLIRDDLREKYGLEPVNSPETYAAYLKAVAKNEKGMTPYGLESAETSTHNLDKQLLVQKNNWKEFTGLPFTVKTDDAKAQVFNMYETPEFDQLLTYYKDLADNGGWSRNALTSKSSTTDDFKAGKVASMSHNVTALGGVMADALKAHPDWKLALADLSPDSKKSAAISTQNGMAIHATSEKAERALMALDLFQNDKQLHDLVMYGIAGTNYTPEGDDKFSKTDKYANYNSFSNWAWTSTLDRVDSNYPQASQDIEKQWAGKVFNYELESFVFDKTKVVNEVANVGNVMTRYLAPLEYGLIKDLDKGKAELIKQMKAAGSDKIQAELQSQIDAFLAK
ncbi:putative aldouronate transport system substrate-binding protein [Paenibacillaceae bacterium GAS479]|nr:putative aldouronate transport system substrate-binding protein [Paenibacillaceae bacterium GAS479]